MVAPAPLKIAFVLNYWSDRGGTERYAKGLARWLVHRGHKVHVFCRDAGDSAQGITFQWWPGTGRGFLGIAEGYLASRFVGLSAFDIVQSFGRSASYDVFRAGGGVHQAWLDIKNSALPARLWSRLSPRDYLERWIDRRAFTRAKMVVCNSQLVLEQVVRIHDVAPQSIRLVRNGVDLQRFRPNRIARSRARQHWSISSKGRVAVFVGGGFKRKGLNTAAKAFERVASSSDRLVVIGRDSSGRRLLRSLHRRLGEQMVVMGHLDDVEN
ncbi:MAG: glycosyltransferase family 4 protein, partial [Proteobacteria bacterium]|nr:glycosyltransferase family 4 protein [Pseudomonadota bacterium]